MNVPVPTEPSAKQKQEDAQSAERDSPKATDYARDALPTL